MEDLCHHDKYVGKRKNRGLFVDSRGNEINADMQGALNIIRKADVKDEIKWSLPIEGYVVNPTRVNLVKKKCIDFSI